MLEPALRFVAIDADLRDRLVTEPAAFARDFDLVVPRDVTAWLDVIEQTLVLHDAAPRVAVWGGYLAIDPLVRSVVGTCGYKTGPDAEGRVEIAYFTFREFERRGYATAMARHLVDLAGRTPPNPIVRAHTLSDSNSSARILERLRFRRLGPVVDPDDGSVWRWERLTSR